MRTSKNVLLLAAAVVVGCAASPAVSQLVVPPARAQGPVQKWEYLCERMDEQITPTANKLGQQGWDLAAAAGYGASATGQMVWCFKRPLP
jgi:hypothetical protein